MNTTSVNRRKKGKLKEIWRRLKKNKPAVVGLVMVCLILLMAVCADLIIPYEKALTQDYAHVLEKPSAEHWFGTDGYGRDILARVVHGSRNSLTLGGGAAILAMIIGALIGAMCGYIGGAFDQVVMRILDTMKAIPNTMMALAIVAALGASLTNLLIAMVISTMPGYVRVIRSSVIGLTGNEYLESARACGTSNARIIRKHILPNCIGVIIIQLTMNISAMILQAASLSFIGMGIQPPAAEWGAMLSEAREYMRNAAYMMVFPGLAIVLTALSFNLLGDGLRDALDPRLKS